MKNFLRDHFVWLWLVVCGIGLIAWAAYLKATAYVSVEWSTASELDVAGFLIGRSESRDQPFQVINDQLIRASDTPLTGGEYIYRDRSIENGHTYFYELIEVGLNGERERLSVVSVVAHDDSLKVGFIGGGLLFAGAGVILLRTLKSKGLVG